MITVHPDAHKWTLSYSGTKQILKSVDHFILYKTERSEPTDAMRMGSAFDRLLLEHKEPLVLPAGINRRTKEGKAEVASYEAEATEKKLQIVTADEMARLRGMVEACMAHPRARRILEAPRQTQCEFHMNYSPDANDEFVVLHGKKDIDIARNNKPPLIVDVKSCASADIEDCLRDIAKYGYYIQDLMYRFPDIAQGIMPDYELIFVEKEPPHGVQILALNEMWLQKAKDDIDFAARRLINYRAGRLSWTGYSDKVTVVAMPNYMNYKARNSGGALVDPATISAVVKTPIEETSAETKPPQMEKSVEESHSPVEMKPEISGKATEAPATEKIEEKPPVVTEPEKAGKEPSDSAPLDFTIPKALVDDLREVANRVFTCAIKKHIENEVFVGWSFSVEFSEFLKGMDLEAPAAPINTWTEGMTKNLIEALVHEEVRRDEHKRKNAVPRSANETLSDVLIRTVMTAYGIEKLDAQNKIVDFCRVVYKRSDYTSFTDSDLRTLINDMGKAAANEMLAKKDATRKEVKAAVPDGAECVLSDGGQLRPPAPIPDPEPPKEVKPKPEPKPKAPAKTKAKPKDDAQASLFE